MPFFAKKTKGFTLIEIMIAIALFSTVITAFLGLFTSAFSSQKRSLNISYLLNNASYATEYLSRAIRMAEKDTDGECLSSPDLNYESTHGGEGIKFLNYNGICEEFYLDGTSIKVKKSGNPEYLTPLNLEIKRLNFEISGESQYDLSQPRVSFTITFKTKGGDPQTINIQSTVSQRQLDIEY